MLGWFSAASACASRSNRASRSGSAAARHRLWVLGELGDHAVHRRLLLCREIERGGENAGLDQAVADRVDPYLVFREVARLSPMPRR